MKKFLALLLALTMVLSLAACGNDQPAETNAPEAETTAPVVADTYTYNTAMSVFPTTWNPHTYETSTDSDMLGYVSDGFYGFDFNETMDGYVMVPYMTTDDHPIDITDQYVGQFGIEEGDTAQVYLVNLRDDLKWEDGTQITAHDFVESAKRLLNPVAQNYRADTMYAGSLVVHNAENYLKQGSYAYSAMISTNYADEEYVPADGFIVKEDGTWAVEGKGDVWFNIMNGTSWSSNSLNAYFNAGYFDEIGNGYWNDLLVPAANDKGFVAATEETVAALNHIVAVLHGHADSAAYEAAAGEYALREWQEFGSFGADKPEMDFSEVGVFALSDLELVYVFDSPMSGFYLKYNLPSSYLVNIELYDSCESMVDGVYTNTYGTSAETTMSYGPYKMTSYQKDKVVTFERNEYYFGLTEDTYQATHIVSQYVPEATTRLEMLIAGQLDVYGLQSTDMEKYSLSDYTYYATGDSTFAMCFNPDMTALTTGQTNAGENINKTIITIPEFRMAMSLAMDRANFCLATSPTNSAAFGLFSTKIISDPEAGTSYRSTDAAKQALANFWGVSEDYGEGKMYADIDEAIASITGYNLAMAQEKFSEAYDIAVAQGLMDEDDVVEICIGTPNSTSAFYNNGYEFIVNNYTEAVKGTKLEGKLTFTRDDTIGNNFAEALQKNQVNMLFGVGWTGSALDPYGLMQVYVDPSYQYDSSTDMTQFMLTININGEDLTASLRDWYDIMNGEVIACTKADGTTVEYSCGTNDNDPEARLTILGAMEQAVLTNYNFIPLMDNSSAQLKGQKIEYYSQEYIYGVGFGGIRYMTFNYTDAEWAEYVASQNGELDYT